MSDEARASPFRALATALLTRTGLAAALGQQFSGKRDLYATLGYKLNPTYQDYLAKYRRMHIARRIVDAPARATWRAAPDVRENEDPETLTDFETAWAALQKRHRILHYLERADRLAGIGQYAVILLGVPGRIEEPVTPGAAGKIEYLTVFSQEHAGIDTWNSDPTDPRYGRPETYSIDLSSDIQGFKGQGTRKVHWTRVLHIADDLLESEVYGTSRLEPVDTLFEDLAKLVGGSAEMFWQGAERGLHVNVDKDFTDFAGDTAAQTALDDKLDEYVHGLRRVIQTQGVEVTPLGGKTADPSNPANLILSLIAGTTGIPKRILLGSESAHLASTQDAFNWAQRIRERQQHFAEPNVLRPLIDRLVMFGALPEPATLEVHWPDVEALTPAEKASVALRAASGAKALNPDDPQSVLTIGEFREMLGLEPTVPADAPGTPGDLGAEGGAM